MISAAELQAFPAVFLRVLGALIILPIGSNLSGIGKIFVLAFGLSLFFISGMNTTNPVIQINYYNLIFEFITGFIISLPSALTVDAVRSLGELFDNQRGVSFATLYDPNSNQNTSIMAQLMSNFCIVLLISAGLLQNILFSLKLSFELYPLYSVGVFSLSKGAVNLIYYISFICGGMFKSFLFCALIYIFIDICSIFLSKVLSAAGINQEIFLLKTVAGFCLLLCILKLDLGSSLTGLAMPNLKLISGAP